MSLPQLTSTVFSKHYHWDSALVNFQCEIVIYLILKNTVICIFVFNLMPGVQIISEAEIFLDKMFSSTEKLSHLSVIMLLFSNV